MFVGHKYGHPDTLKQALGWTETMLKLHRCNKIILCAHADCGAYKNAPLLLNKSAEEIYQHQVQDLREISELCRSQIPRVEIGCLYAAPSETEQEVVFSEVSFHG